MSSSPSFGILDPSSLSNIPEPTLNYAWAGFALLIGLILYTSIRPKDPYATIPAIGRTGFISSCLDGVRFLKQGHILLQDGYEKYKPGIFRVPEITRWHVIITGEKFIEELHKAPEHVLSINEAAKDVVAADYTIGHGVTEDMYHIGIVRTHLTRNLVNLFPDMRNELVLAFEDYIPVRDDWSKVKALNTIMSIVSRTSNRIFVGAPTCREPEYIAVNIQFTVDLIIGANIVNLFPKIVKPIAARWFTFVPGAIRTALKYIGPIVKERQQKIDEYGFDYPDKPNDLLSWLMDEAKGDQRSARNLTLRILIMNFAAIHTTSASFTQALFHLASRPEYIQPIREEIETVIAKEGWTKVAMSRMRKLDSFLKESLRMDGIGGVTLTRKAMKDFTFSDGTRIPKGGVVSVNTISRHLDNSIYADATTFNGYRFSEIREEEEEGDGAKNQMVSTSTDFLPFGHGKHACPGRFFVANEMKAMMAHMVLTYDIKMETEGVRPDNQWFGTACMPDRKAEVLFRKRRQ